MNALMLHSCRSSTESSRVAVSALSDHNTQWQTIVGRHTRKTWALLLWVLSSPFLKATCGRTGPQPPVGIYCAFFKNTSHSEWPATSAMSEMQCLLLTDLVFFFFLKTFGCHFLRCGPLFIRPVGYKVQALSTLRSREGKGLFKNLFQGIRRVIK